MIRNYLFVILLSAVAGCQINRYNAAGKPHGRWIMTDTLEKIYTYKGRYINGLEVGKWKYWWDNKLMQVEKYKGRVANVRFYHPNGKLSLKGKSKLDKIRTLVHWYYCGGWISYDEYGRLKAIRTYDKGQVIKETEY